MSGTPPSPGVMTRAMARAAHGSPTGSSASASGSRSRSGSGGSHVRPDSPRHQRQDAAAAAPARAYGGDESSTESDSDSSRSPSSSASKSSKSLPTSGRLPAERVEGAQGAQAGDANGQQGHGLPQPPAPRANIPVPVAVVPPPGGGGGSSEEPLWEQAWNLFNESPLLKFGAFIAILAIILYLIFGSHDLTTAFGTKGPKPDREMFFINQTKLLFRKQFPSQSLETQLSILAAADSVLGAREPRQPSAIAVLTPPGMSEYFARCFAHKLGRLLNEAFEFYGPATQFTAQELTHAPDVTWIHTALKAYFARGGHAVLFDGVDKLVREEHLNILHAFTDNFMAPYKRATFFFTLTVPEKIYTAYDWKYEYGSDIVYKLLDSAWRDVVSNDKRPAIIARVTPTVILLKPGDECWDS